ncbi:MAG: hypothetical protein HZB42_12270 [Sphingobacteriales bacterium]|nr:hypothetical protein [Sphingobacteriales bacterium]
MRKLLFLLFLSFSFSSFAQHCPWDCSGMILIKTDATSSELKKLNAVLVDSNKNIIVDTMYGTGLETYDTCRFMLYDDFKAYRTERTELHYWYRYDTLYRFADSFALVRVNYCRYKRSGAMLYIRFNKLNDTAQRYEYIEVPQINRIHLHDYNMMINRKEHVAIREAVQPFVLHISRKQFGLTD